MRDCPICRGSGEVEAGITYGFQRTGWSRALDGTKNRDEAGNLIPLGHPTRIRPNPSAQVGTFRPATRYNPKGLISFLQENPLEPLWGIAICQRCCGTGLDL